MKIKLVLTKFSITPEIGLNEKGFKTIEMLMSPSNRIKLDIKAVAFQST